MKNKKLNYFVILVSTIILIILIVWLSYNSVLLTTYQGIREAGLTKMGMEYNDWSKLYSIYESYQSKKTLILIISGIVIIASIIFFVKKNKKMIKYFAIINLPILLVVYFGSNIIFQNMKLNQFVNENKFYEAIILSKNNNVKENDVYIKSIEYLTNENKPLKALDLLKYLEKDITNNEFLNNIKYELTKSLIEKNEYSKAEDLIKTILDYKDSNDLLNEIKYLKAVNLSNKNETHLEAIQIFNEIIDYKDSSELVTKLKNKHLYDGTWKAVNEYGSSWKWIINGEYCYLIALYDSAIKYNCIYGNTIKLYSGDKLEYEFTINGYNLKYVWDRQIGLPNYKPHRGSYWTMSKTSDSIVLPKEKTNPTIGMTKEEVEKSTWGNPEKINKTTTAYGTREQWVYSTTRYIYFNENGIVYSIQQ